jgi:hypothetical protein
MFKRPTSHLAAHRGTRGLPTIASGFAALAIAGLALGACTAPTAGGALSGPAIESFESHRAKEQQRNVASAIQVNPGAALDDSWDSLRKEHQRGYAPITSATQGAASDDDRESLRKEHLHSLATTAPTGPFQTPGAAR